MSEPLPQPVNGRWRKASWPARIFVVLYLFDCLVRSFLSLASFDDWAREIGMQRYPKSLPTEAERKKIARGKSEKFDTYGERLGASFSSLGDYFNPVPDDDVAEKIDGALGWAKYIHAWTGTRMRFFEKLVGMDQRWTMFSPDTGTGTTVARCTLIYADGHRLIHRPICDRDDLNIGPGYWLAEKYLQPACKVHRDRDVRRGYCNWLAARFPVSPSGAKLKYIEIATVNYTYPKADEDAHAVLARESGNEPETPFHRFEVKTGRGWSLK